MDMPKKSDSFNELLRENGLSEVGDAYLAEVGRMTPRDSEEAMELTSPRGLVNSYDDVDVSLLIKALDIEP